MEYSIRSLAERFGGTVVGDGNICVSRIAPLERAVTGEISFLSQPRLASLLQTTGASAVILTPAMQEHTAIARIVCADPYLFYARVSQLLAPQTQPDAGVDATAVVKSPVPDSCSIGPSSSVGERVRLGNNVVVGAGCHIGDDCEIGDGTYIHANAVIYHGCRLGKECIIHSGAVIGADGFGFAREKDGRWVKIRQTGGVVLGDGVEIGANSTVDRGALDDTVLEAGVKIDNLVQIGHNVHIGEHSIAAGCVGISGSARIGKRCMLGGGAGIKGHIEICDDTVISGRTIVTKSIRQPGVYTSALLMQKHEDWVKNISHVRHLDAMARRLKKLEKTIAKLDLHETD